MHFDVELLSGHLFVFFNRKRDFVKILCWDQDGLALWAKRLESGTFENFNRDAEGNFEIDHAELMMMLRGIEIRRPKRACGKCKDTVVQTPAGEEPGGPTTPIAGSDYGFGIYTQLIVSKFADHMPLYRCEDFFARSGLLIPRNTQLTMLANIAGLIAPLLGFMSDHVRGGCVLGVDDTSVRRQCGRWPSGRVDVHAGVIGSSSPCRCVGLC